MKPLSIKQILITILVSYLITSFVNAELNPFNLSMYARVIMIFIISISLLVQLGIKNSF
jgi:hypothetical protein